MRKWTKKELDDFVNSDELRDYTKNFDIHMKKFKKEKRRKFIAGLSEYIKILNTPMAI